jgi:hypothetical protein
MNTVASNPGAGQGSDGGGRVLAAAGEFCCLWCGLVRYDAAVAVDSGWDGMGSSDER